MAEEFQHMTTRLDDVEHRAPDERIACTIVRQAIANGASEVRIEPTKQDLSVAFRIGDKLREIMHMPNYMTIPLAIRFKAMAALDVNSGSDQQGEMWVRTHGKGYRLTLSTTPTEYGENLLIRLPV